MRTYTKILTLTGWFILVGYALTPHMWDEQNEPWWGPEGLQRKGGQDKEWDTRGGEGCQERGLSRNHPSLHPFADVIVQKLQ